MLKVTRPTLMCNDSVMWTVGGVRVRVRVTPDMTYPCRVLSTKVHTYFIIRYFIVG